MGISSFNVMSDALASEGIIDFDAVAYIKGTQPRFVGRPATYANSGYPNYPGASAIPNPYSSPYGVGGGLNNGVYRNDTFLKSSAESSKQKNQKPMNYYYAPRSGKTGSAAKAVGVGAIIAASAAAIAMKFKNIPAKEDVTGLLSKIKNAKCIKDIKNSKLIKDIKNSDIAEKIKKLFKNEGSKKIKIPGKLKAAGIAALALFGVVKIVQSKSKNQYQMPELQKSLY